MRKSFEAQMQNLHHKVLEMGAMCESAIASAVTALLDGTHEQAERAIELEVGINKLERDIEELCYQLILRQQPVAGDLRQLTAAMKMAADMERIGDQAADIAEIAGLKNACTAESSQNIREMSLAAISMVTNSIDAYVKQNLTLAAEVIKADDNVDTLFNNIKRELSIMLITEPKSAECVIDLLMVAKYLERIGDHAVNIAEWVIFAVTGEYYT